MSVHAISDWRLPGCDERCWPRRHDPSQHEAYGARMALARAPVTRIEAVGLTIDLAAKRVVADGDAVVLAGYPWRLLAALASRPGEAVSIDELASALWPDESAWLPRAVAGHRITVMLPRLRRQLGRAGAYVARVGPQGDRATGLRLDVPPWAVRRLP